MRRRQWKRPPETLYTSDNIKTGFEEILWRSGLKWSGGAGKGLLSGFCECSNEYVFHKRKETWKINLN